jgi:hypothetical protein
MNIKPTPEFLEACRRVLGADDPRTVITAMRAGGPVIDELRTVHAEIVAQKQPAQDLDNDCSSASTQ